MIPDPSRTASRVFVQYSLRPPSPSPEPSSSDSLPPKPPTLANRFPPLSRVSRLGPLSCVVSVGCPDSSYPPRKGTFWRITVIYLSSLLIIGLNVPYNQETLLGGSDGAGKLFRETSSFAHYG